MEINSTELLKFTISAVCFVVCIYIVCKSKWTGPIEAVKMVVSYVKYILSKITYIISHIYYRKLYRVNWFFRHLEYHNLLNFLTDLRDTTRDKSYISVNTLAKFIKQFSTEVDSTGFDYLHRCIRIAKTHSKEIHRLFEQLYSHIEDCLSIDDQTAQLPDNILSNIKSDCNKLIDCLQEYAEAIHEHNISTLSLY